MTKNRKIIKVIIIGIALATLVSGIGILILIVTLWTADSLEEYEAKEALQSLEIRLGKGNISNVRVATSTYWHHQNYYSRFNAKADFIEKIINDTEVSRYKLQEEPINSDTCQIILAENIKRSWWNPQDIDVDKCYSDNRASPGYFSVLFYHPDSGTAFYYHHNN